MSQWRDLKVSNNNKLLILGAGGHGKVVADAAESMQLWSDIYFLDDAITTGYSYEIIGGISSLNKWKNDFDSAIIAIGNNQTRASIMQQCCQAGLKLATIIHATAYISKSVTIGMGSVIFSNSVVNPGAIIGKGCIINTAAIIEHDCNIGNYTHISPNVALAGGVQVGEYSWVGIGSNVIEEIVIGNNVIVGAGSVVINNIKDNSTVAGVPVKVIKKS